MPYSDGFSGQRLVVLPRPLVGRLAKLQPFAQLQITDIGYYPKADGHLMRRPTGCPQAVVILCVAGGGWVECAGQRSGLGARQALVIPAGTAHAYGADADHPWTIWWMHLSGAQAATFIHRPGVLPAEEATRLVTLWDEALTRLEHDDSQHGLLVAAGTAWHLMTLLMDQSPRHGDAVQAAVRLMGERLDGHFDVVTLAQAVGLSPSHFAARFRATMGRSVMDHYLRLRMAQARELLDTSTLPIAMVAERTGFSDPFHFSRVFRRIHACSPRKYRQQHKG